MMCAKFYFYIILISIGSSVTLLSVYQ